MENPAWLSRKTRCKNPDGETMMGLRLFRISVAFKERFNRDFRDVYRDSIEQMQQRG